MKRIFPHLLLLLGAITQTSAFALSPEDLRLVGQIVSGSPMTLSEVSAMPPPCRAIGMGEINGVFWPEGMNKNGTNWILDQPENAMAKGAVWFHHYCWGMLEKHRAFAAVKTSERDFKIKQWRNEMQYIVNWTTQQKINWAYLPVVHMEIAESYVQEKNYPNAIQSAYTALELNADFVPGYILLDDIYERIKDRAKALAAVSEGIKHVPGSKGLQRRYKELGGRMPFPEPYAKPETPENVSPATGEGASDKPNGDPAPEKSPSSTTEPEKIGVPGNPYCRFCP